LVAPEWCGCEGPKRAYVLSKARGKVEIFFWIFLQSKGVRKVAKKRKKKA
jgi:hypothetical protein